MSDRQETATVAGGCFWCIEELFRRVTGVKRVVSGYTGGSVENPTYNEVCSGETGHAEAVQITFDPQLITFREILTIFLLVHDPTTLNRQGADIGTQYRSAIFFHDSQQKETAANFLREEELSGNRNSPVVTEIAPLAIFYPAENYHQGYYSMNSSQPYCRMVIDPKISKLQKFFGERMKPANEV